MHILLVVCFFLRASDESEVQAACQFVFKVWFLEFAYLAKKIRKDRERAERSKGSEKTLEYVRHIVDSIDRQSTQR